MNKEIYGITGKKGSGKDSFATRVRIYNGDFSVIRFADDLKYMTSAVFGFPLEHMEDQDVKAQLFLEPVEMDLFLEKMMLATGLELTPRGLVAKTLREVLQFFGTDYVRSIRDSYWVDRVIHKINAIGSKVLVTDCRFPNEADAIKLLGGTVIRVERPALPKSLDPHPSELEMDKIVPDFTLNVEENDFSSQKTVAHIVALGGSHLLKQGASYASLSAQSQALNLALNFNECLRIYEDVSKHRANFCWGYNNNGQKELKVADVAEYNPPSAEAIAAAKAEVPEIMKKAEEELVGKIEVKENENTPGPTGQ